MTDLLEAKARLLKWLFKAGFGRIAATADEMGRAIHLLGTINRLIKKAGG
jgi:hypothetical protein